MSLQTPTVLIVNPNAQAGKVGRRWPALEPALREVLGDFTTRMTSRPGDAAALCEAALEQGAKLVLAVGGDGTASEVVAGFMRAGAGPASGAAFGLLPCGTGGDLRRTFGSPPDVIDAASHIVAARPRAIDVGQVDYTTDDGQSARAWFINVGGFGLAGTGSRLVNASGKWLGTKLTYYVGVVRAMMQYRNTPVSMQLDGGPERQVQVYTVAIANGRYFGGGMQIAPSARPDDGQLEVVTLGDLSRIDAVGLSSAIYKGKHLAHPKIDAAAARTVTARPVNPSDRIYLDLDGESPGRLPATFTVLPGALWMRV